MNGTEYLTAIMQKAEKVNASDIHIVAGVPPAFRIDGEIILADAPPITRPQAAEMTYGLLNDIQRQQLEHDLELSFSRQNGQAGRYRVTVYYHGGNPEMSLRRCNTKIPTREELGLPEVVEQLARLRTGLVLVTGPTGTGKTTTLNFIIDLINSERRCKIVTIEDPIEFVHRPKKAIIVQQEVRTDTRSFARALVHVLRQDPDVICVGEMRDLETIATALTAAETGHLVIATLHTASAMQTVERIVDVFPPVQQNQIITQLANCLQGVIAQLLLPRADKKGRVLATEILLANTAMRAIIRDNNLPQLTTVMQTGRRAGMHTMDECLCELYERAIIGYDTAVGHARDPHMLKRPQRTGNVQ